MANRVVDHPVNRRYLLQNDLQNCGINNRLPPPPLSSFVRVNRYDYSH